MAIRKSSLSGTPSGSTANRPTNPQIGDTYNNGTLGVEEIYTSVGWVAKSAPASVPVNIVATDVGTSRAFNNAQASVSFTAGEGGGLTSDYTVTATPTSGGTSYTNTGSSSPILISGLQSAVSYQYTAQARNNFGSSLASTVSSAVTATTVPQAPTIGVATISGSDVTVNWTLNSNGGKPLTSIVITPYLNGVTAQTSRTAATISSTSYTFTGASALDNGASYTFKVKAINANGESQESSASNNIGMPLSVTYLVIAGGGGGGNGSDAANESGGGGAGGYRSSVSGELSGTNTSPESSLSISGGTSYNLTVGAGGGGSSSGGNSIFHTITSTGGGNGGSNNSGGSGGSGGGGSHNQRSGGSGINGQGNNGGTPGGSSSAAGGGGAGAAGANGVQGSVAATGGIGISSSITGTATYRAGGGGGGNPSTTNTGGNGGGGNGGSSPTNGTANTGGGGGGKLGGNGSIGANGGSGVVILRYPSGNTISASAGLTHSTTTVGANKVTTFTAGTGTVSFT